MSTAAKALGFTAIAAVAIAVFVYMSAGSSNDGPERTFTAEAKAPFLSSPYSVTCGRSTARGEVTGAATVEIQELSLDGCKPCGPATVRGLPYEARGVRADKGYEALIVPVELAFDCGYGVECYFGDEETRLDVIDGGRRPMVVAKEVVLARLEGSQDVCATKSRLSAKFVVTEQTVE